MPEAKIGSLIRSTTSNSSDAWARWAARWVEGTLLWAASIGANTADKQMAIRIYRSDDGGRSWSRTRPRLSMQVQKPVQLDHRLNHSPAARAFREPLKNFTPLPCMK